MQFASPVDRSLVVSFVGERKAGSTDDESHNAYAPYTTRPSSCFHPDFNRRPWSHTRSVSRFLVRVAGYTADRESHPTLQEVLLLSCIDLLITYFSRILAGRAQFHYANLGACQSVFLLLIRQARLQLLIQAQLWCQESELKSLTR